MACINSDSSPGGTRSSADCTRVASRWPIRPTSSAGVYTRRGGGVGSGECVYRRGPPAILRLWVSSATSHVSDYPVNPEKAYQEIVALSRAERMLASCLDLLEWDEEVSMPRNG